MQWKLNVIGIVSLSMNHNKSWNSYHWLWKVCLENLRKLKNVLVSVGKNVRHIWLFIFFSSISFIKSPCFSWYFARFLSVSPFFIISWFEFCPYLIYIYFEISVAWKILQNRTHTSFLIYKKLPSFWVRMSNR